jgi:DMSO/TMAO reductase YedYZ molybdopterin-dependent catalytic subunit
MHSNKEFNSNRSNSAAYMNAEEDQSIDRSRRAFLGALPLAILGTQFLRTDFAWAQMPAAGQPLAGKGLIVGRPVPLTAETPLQSITTWITPNDRFPILTSIAKEYPSIEPSEWRLNVGGLVGKQLTLTYEQLRKLPARRMTSIVECAGNSRNSVSPPLARSFLNSGYVGNAEWKGTPLRLVLEQAGLKPGVVEIVLEGTDRGTAPFAPQEVNFAKSVPVAKALDPDTLLVYEMNGVAVPREYGGPVRAIIPGWYGTYQVKWLSRLEAIDHTFDGAFMTKNWRVRRKQNGSVREEPVSQIGVKSLITNFAAGARLGAGAQVIRGVAWSGGNDIKFVSVSTDGGTTWRPARLHDQHSRYSWRLWELPWTPKAVGSYTLMARATDMDGVAQPLEYDLDLNGFQVNHVQSVKVEVTT